MTETDKPGMTETAKPGMTNPTTPGLHCISVVVFGHGGAPLADQEIHVGSFVGLQHMVDVEFPVA
jgi:hypothetical protein